MSFFFFFFKIRTFSTAAFAEEVLPCQPENPCVGTVSDCPCLAFASIVHILDMMHLKFLKTLSYFQLFAFLISQPATSQQELTVLMTAVSSHIQKHNRKKTQQDSNRLYLSSLCSICVQYEIQSFVYRSSTTVFKCEREFLHHSDYSSKLNYCTRSLGLFGRQCLLQKMWHYVYLALT